MGNFEKAVLSRGPKDGVELVVNLDYGDYVTMVMPRKRGTQFPRGEERFHYDRTKEVRGGRHVYAWDGAEVAT